MFGDFVCLYFQLALVFVLCKHLVDCFLSRSNGFVVLMLRLACRSPWLGSSDHGKMVSALSTKKISISSYQLFSLCL